MNRSVWTVITCTMLLVIICNFNTMKAAPANNSTNSTQVPAKTTPKAPAPTTPKPAAPPAAKPQPHPTSKPAGPPAKNGPPSPPKAPAPTTKRPHDERGVMAAAAAPIVLGLIGQVIGYIMQYVAS
ncbi:unnamed protein product [Schistosoma margrebowiei]|uniref:Uncharacterized protein n=1 Tax=Schistosoma margrebowiei TaxID=48269 RepID=A0AA84ZET6_9TREM|nr:unnamed protein product [Schistosoma margrebowiei]